MKKILLFIAIFCNTLVFSQSSDCNAPMPICGNVSPIPTVVDIPSVGTVGCLSTTPNPSWFIFKVATPGDLIFSINQGNNSPDYNNLDIDFICWGPFLSNSIDCENDLYGYSGNITIPNNVADCSYSASTIESITINSASVNEYYLILTTNYSNQAGFFKIEQTNIGTTGAGSVNCDVVCGVSLGPDQIICSTSITSLNITANFNEAITQPGTPSFVWYLDNVLQPSLTSQTISVSQSGTWKVVATKPGCIDPSEDEVLIILDNSVINETPSILDGPINNCNPTIDLTSNEDSILNGNNPTNYSFSYYLDEIDSLLEINEITDVINFQVNENTTIYVNIKNINTNCFYFTNFLIDVDCPSSEIIVNTQPVDQNINENGNVSFVTNSDNTVSYQWQMRLNGESNWSNLSNGGTSPIFNGVDTNNLTLNQVSASFNGNSFRLMMTSNTDLKYTNIVTLNVTTLSTNDFDTIPFNIFPNPVNSSFTINLESIDILEDLSFVIFDINGRKIMQRDLYSKNTIININSLDSGVYFLQLISKDRRTLKKIIKN